MKDENMIRNLVQNRRVGYWRQLRYRFSTINFLANETYAQTQENTQFSQTDAPINNTTKESQTIKPTYTNYTRIYSQNKRRLQEISTNNQQKEFLFDETYIKTTLLDSKYFYADIVTISSHVIQYLSSKIHTQNHFPSPIVTLTHLHFLLCVYHLYIKEFRTLKEQVYSIVQHFLDCFVLNETFEIRNNLEIFVYLRKFIDSEIMQGNGSKIIRITQKYCTFLEIAYRKEITSLNMQLSAESSKDLKFTHKTMKKSKLLENYLLSYPSFWISTFGSGPQNSEQNLSEPVIKSYDYFVCQFSTLFRESIRYWVNFQSQYGLSDPMPVNFSYRKFLLEQFKQEELNKCFNSLRLVIHRLWSILEIPKLIYQRPQQVSRKPNEHNLIQQKYLALTKKYEVQNLNFLSYLSKDKLIQGEEIKFMRLLILMKNLFGYHTLRRISDKQLTQHLERLLENNWSQIITSKDGDKKRQINILLGELISRLVSGSWTDQEDILGKFFEKGVTMHHQNKGKRDNRGEWSQ